jgi:lathosterol oxidase
MEIQMTDAYTLIDIAQHRALGMFVFDLARYVMGAGLIAGLVWLLRRTRFASRKIQKRDASHADIRREVMASVRTVLVYTLVSVLTLWAMRHGYLSGLDASFGVATDLAVLAALIIAHDAYFYWAHRAMHHPKLFKTFHRFHHKTITPTPWAAYSFAVPEAFVMAIFMPIWLALVPTPGWVTFSFLAIMILRNCMGHAGLELHARGWASHPILKWISTTTHHDLHHAGSFNHNFGFYFTFWDKVMGTEHPNYVATFDRVTAPAVHVPTELTPTPVL